MVLNNPLEVAKVVQERLRTHGIESHNVRVLADEVRLGGEQSGWWYVPVSYVQDSDSVFLYYKAFADIEESLEEKEHLNVLLVPRVIYQSER